VIFEPMDLLGKLAALVPPRRFNPVRYHGVLSSSARWRSRIVPIVLQGGNNSQGCQGCLWKEGKNRGQGKRHENPGKLHPRNYGCTGLMKRVLRIVGINCLLSGNPAVQASQQVLIGIRYVNFGVKNCAIARIRRYPNPKLGLLKGMLGSSARTFIATFFIFREVRNPVR
jgi:hypothetical protein